MDFVSTTIFSSKFGFCERIGDYFFDIFSSTSHDCVYTTCQRCDWLEKWDIFYAISWHFVPFVFAGSLSGHMFLDFLHWFSAKKADCNKGIFCGVFSS